MKMVVSMAKTTPHSPSLTSEFSGTHQFRPQGIWSISAAPGRKTRMQASGTADGSLEPWRFFAN